MYHAPGKAGLGGKKRPDVAHHTFHGSHFPSKLAGAVDVALYSSRDAVAPGATVVLRAELFNGKVGHPIPSGATEERMLWLEVSAVDAKGKTYPLPVDEKDFEGEEYTIGDSKAIAYQAMGEIMKISGYKGISRDGQVPDGARIFRKPFFDPKGRMTICQWYTAKNDAVDYRIGPRETKIETYTWTAPGKLPSGTLTIVARLYYSQVPSSVGEFMKLPADEYAPILVNEASLSLTVPQ